MTLLDADDRPTVPERPGRLPRTDVKLLYSAFKTHIEWRFSASQWYHTSCLAIQGHRSEHGLHLLQHSFILVSSSEPMLEAAVCLNVLVNNRVYLLSELFCSRLHAQ